MPEKHLGDVLAHVPGYTASIANKQAVTGSKIAGHTAVVLDQFAAPGQHCHQLVTLLDALKGTNRAAPNPVARRVSGSACIDPAICLGLALGHVVLARRRVKRPELQRSNVIAGFVFIQ